MKNILKELSGYQIQALNKGLSFRIDLDYISKKAASTHVTMSYNSTGDIAQCYVFDTTFSENTSASKKEEKLANIKYFIETIVK